MAGSEHRLRIEPESNPGPWAEIVVDDATYIALKKIAQKLDCTVSAALEEVIREFKP